MEKLPPEIQQKLLVTSVDIWRPTISHRWTGNSHSNVTCETRHSKLVMERDSKKTDRNWFEVWTG